MKRSLGKPGARGSRHGAAGREPAPVQTKEGVFMCLRQFTRAVEDTRPYLCVGINECMRELGGRALFVLVMLNRVLADSVRARRTAQFGVD